MNKKVRLMSSGMAIACGFALLLGSCVEKSTIDLGNNPVGSTATDTTYIAAVETPQQRNVLMEEFTGVSCPPCPNGHVALAAIINQYMDVSTQQSRVKAIGIQVFDFKQAEPIEHGLTQHDNRTQAGTELSKGIFGTLGQTPVSGIDRIPKNGSMYVDRSFWAAEVNNRINVPTKVNINISSSYNATSKIATIKVHAAYTGDVARKQVLTVAIIEDDIIDGQENGLRIDTFYHHEHVLRDILTSATGLPVMNDLATKEKGRVYERTFTYNLSDKTFWVPQNCRVIAFISNAESGDKEVQQVAEAHLQ